MARLRKRRRINSRSQNSQENEDEEIDDEETITTNGTIYNTPSINGDNRNTVTGVLEKIRLQNFMCHSNLELDLNPCINVITGRNGSGKSAIMTALLICLGAKAKQTNRSKQLGGLVKTGQPSCLVSVQIRNLGNRSLRYEDFGPSIIIERFINKKGGSSYRVKSHDGHLISKKSKFVRNILDYMGIQIDNPCTVMTQDASRQFLTTSSPKDRFRFFMKATLFEDIQNNLSRMKNTISTWKENIEHKKDVIIGPYERKLETLKQKVEVAAKVENFQSQYQELVKELAWARVADEEDAFKELQAKKEHAQTNRNRYQTQLEENQQTKQQLQENLTELNQEIEQINNEIEEIGKQIEDSEARDYQHHKELDLKRTHIHNCDTQIRYKRRDIEKREKTIQEKIEQSSEQNEQLKAAYQDIQKIKQKIEEKEEEFNNLESEMKQHKSNTQQAYDVKTQADRKFTSVRKRLNEEKHRYSELQDQSQNHLKVFGQNTERLLDMIRRSTNKFRKPPIGPIGSLIQLRDPSWASCLEYCLRNYIRAFIVDSHEDERQLQQLLRKAQQPTAVFVMKYTDQQYNTAPRKPPSDFTTIEDMIYIDERKMQALPLDYNSNPGYNVVNATVMNLMRDQNRIENTILIPKRKDAKEVMFHAHRPPPNVADCYTNEGRHLQRHPSGIEIDSGIDMKPPRVWSADFHSLISDTKQQIQSLEAQVRELDKERQEADRDYKRVKQQSDGVYRKRTKLMQEIQELKTRKNTLQTQMEENESNQNFNVSYLRNAIQNLEQQIEEEEKKKTQYEAELKKLEEEYSKDNTPLQELKEQRDEKSNRWNQVNKEIRTLIRRMKQTDKEIDKCTRNVNESDSALTKFDNELSQKQKELDNETEKAKNSSEERIERTRPTSHIKEELAAIIKHIQAHQQQLDNQDVADVREEYDREKTRLENMSTTIERNISDMKKIHKITEERVEETELQLAQNRAIANTYFGTFLQQQHHHGELVFDMEKKTLDFSITLSTANEHSSGVSDVRTLSGGERSFSTVSFLLALWSLVDLPFRAVDEVDIFMDSMYRHKSLNLLLNHAKERMPEKQLIMLTPHDTSSIPSDDPKIRVLKMADPRPQMRQTTLDSQ